MPSLSHAQHTALQKMKDDYDRRIWNGRPSPLPGPYDLEHSTGRPNVLLKSHNMDLSHARSVVSRPQLVLPEPKPDTRRSDVSHTAAAQTAMFSEHRRSPGITVHPGSGLHPQGRAKYVLLVFELAYFFSTNAYEL